MKRSLRFRRRPLRIRKKHSFFNRKKYASVARPLFFKVLPVMKYCSTRNFWQQSAIMGGMGVAPDGKEHIYSSDFFDTVPDNTMIHL